MDRGNNLVLWGPQVTIDRTFAVPGAVESICRAFVNHDWFQSARDELRNIADLGLLQDHLIFLPHGPDSRSDRDLEAALQYLREHHGCELSQVGGNPAIGALTGYHLGTHRRDLSLPMVRYAGLYTRSLRDFIDQQTTLRPEFHRVLAEVFDPTLCVEITDSPTTLALESSHHKLMLSYAPGRRLESISDSGDFTDYLRQLARAVDNANGEKVLFALSVPHPLELGARLIDDIKAQFGTKAQIFIGCSSFRKGNVPEFDRVRNTWPILERADILSMNETELNDLHSFTVGGGTHQDKPLSYKLLELPTAAIKVCHGAAGALMDAGPDPGRIINSTSYERDPAAFLEESLRLATDGATFGIASPRGHDATEAGVRVFSSTVRNRNAERFNAMFLNVLETMPPGLIAVHTPVIARSLSALTGVGARFDGLLTTFLMRS